MTGGLSLGELVDLEAALRAGHGPEALAPQAIAAHAGDSRRDRARLLSVWLDAVYEGRSRPGERLAGVMTLVAGGLVAVGTLLGVGAAQYALRYDGTHPVNVVTFLSVMILPQIGLLLLVALSFAVRSVTLLRAAECSLGLAHHFLLRLVRGRSGEAGAAGGGALDLRALYRPAESWRVFFSAQLFGVAFNIAASLTALGLVSFTDLAFSWSTTLRVDGEAAHRFAAALGTPFPELVPSREVIEATRYHRLEGRYGGGVDTRAVDLAATAAWWPFLAACLVTYGLLPRLILAALGYLLYRRRLARAPLEAYDIDRLVRGLAARLGGFQRSGGPDDVRPPEATRFAPLAASRARGPAIVWRDAPWSDELTRGFVTAATGAEPFAIYRSGADFDGEETARRLPAAAGPIYVVVDSFDGLQKSLIRFLRGLRAGVGERRLIVLLPAEESGGRLISPADLAQRTHWRRAAQRLGDAFLGADFEEGDHE